MAKAVKSIRISDTVIGLLDCMEEYYKTLEEKQQSASRLYYDCLLYGVDGILDKWQQIYNDKIQIGPEALQKDNKQTKAWYDMKIRAKVLQITLDPRMGEAFSGKFITDSKEQVGDKGDVYVRVVLNFDQSWENRGHLEWKWILKKCCVAGYVTEQAVDVKTFHKNAKERQGTLTLRLSNRMGSRLDENTRKTVGNQSDGMDDGCVCEKKLPKEWMLHYAKILLACDNVVLQEFGIEVAQVQLIETKQSDKKQSDKTKQHDKMELNVETEQNSENNRNDENTKMADEYADKMFLNPGDSLKSLRIDQEFLNRVQMMCDIEDRLLGQYVALNNMLVSMLRFGVLERIHMLQNIAKSLPYTIRTNGKETEELSRIESWMKERMQDETEKSRGNETGLNHG